MAKVMRNLSSDLMVEILGGKIGAKSSEGVIQALLHHQTHRHVSAHIPSKKKMRDLSQLTRVSFFYNDSF